MRTPYNPNQSPRVIIIQKLYGNFFNDDKDLTFPKHRFKKFIKDVVLGTIERDEVIKDEVNKSKQLFKKFNWPTIDVTRKSVEETAASILKILEIKKNQ